MSIKTLNYLFALIIFSSDDNNYAPVRDDNSFVEFDIFEEELADKITWSIT